MGNIRIARLLGIPIIVNLSWLITLAIVTTMLALRYYPGVIRVPYRDDYALHWAMAISSGLAFFASILLHELAHSIVAQKQGIPVKSITLFIFGGVSQIGGEAKRPLHEFVMAIIGPLTSVLLSGIFGAIWWLSGHSPTPLSLVLEWLFIMNLVIAIFNMAPGFPMDGGRVLRSLIWGVTGNLYKATRVATLIGRGVGYGLVFVGGLAFLDLLGGYVDQWSGPWLVIVGLFLESSARQSWMQAKALDVLSRYSAQDIMNADLETADSQEIVHYLMNRGGRHFIFFISDADERIIGVLTEKEAIALGGDGRLRTTAEQVMRRADEVETVGLKEDAAAMLQTMETASVWHLPVVDEGRVIGVVSKESLLRLLASNFLPRRSGLAGTR